MKDITLGDIFADGERIIRRHWKSIVLLWLLWIVPLQLVLFILPYKVMASTVGLPVEQISLLLRQGLTALSGSFYFVGLVRLVGNSYHSEVLSWGSVWRESLYFWPAYVYTSAVQAFLLIGLFILLIIPGVIASFFWMFAAQACILGGLQGWSALQYSFQIMRGRALSTFIYIVLMSLGALALVSIPMYGLMLLPIPERELTVIVDAVSFFGAGVLYIWQTVMYLLYEEAFTEDLESNVDLDDEDLAE